MENEIKKLAQQLAHGLSLEQMRDRMEQPRTVIREVPPEVAVRTAQYWDNVFSGNTQKAARRARTFKQEMGYEDARRMVMQEFNRRADEIEGTTGAPFVWDIPKGGELAAIIRQMIMYFINDPACEWPLNKGLFIYGAPGIGKTEIMGIMKAFCDAADLSKRFEMTSLSALYGRARSDKQFDAVQSAVTMDRCFDEFLRASGAVNYYGDQIDLNEAIIEERYNRKQAYGQISYFISNGDTQTIKSMLSLPVFDRVRGMCTSVHFPGASKR